MTADAIREALFRALEAGEPADPCLLDLLARLTGRTRAALLLDLYAEALGVA